jgi:hypothetical protein
MPIEGQRIRTANRFHDHRWALECWPSLELKNAIQALLSTAQWREAMATSEGASAAYAKSVGLGTSLDGVRDYPARLASVRPEDVARVASTYLPDGALHVAFFGDTRYIFPERLHMGVPTAIELPK